MTKAQQQDEPLRILFCGSEGFSIVALEALREYQKSPGSNILSIDVATRKDKAGGRGMKELRAPPIKRTAAQLGLRLHQFDTFTGWHLPEYQGAPQQYINLVVAVSFGLLVPPRILNNAKFGGINVHPSMLPDLRGAAPINWTIMKGHTHTGVTVQTLHPSKFDHGVILDQTPAPGIAIPNHQDITAHELRHFLAPIGAEMLVNAIQNKLYLQTRPEIVRSSKQDLQLSLAPKIIPSMKALDPFNDDLTMVLRKNRAMPKLWAEARFVTEKGEQTKRIIFGSNMRPVNTDDLQRQLTQSIVDDVSIGVPFAVVSTEEDIHQSQLPIYLKLRNNSVLLIPDMLVAGDRESPASAAAARAKLFNEPSSHGSLKLYKFQQPLAVQQAKYLDL